MFTKLGEYEKSLTEVRTKRIGIEAKLQVIMENMDHNGDVTIPSTETSDSPSREEYLGRLRSETLKLELERNKLLQKFTSQHPQIVSLENELKLAQDKLRKELMSIISEEKMNIQSLHAEEAVLQSKIYDVKNELKQFAQSEFELNKISRGIQETRELYSLLLKQREEARIALSKQDQIVRVKVVSAAMAPEAPLRPNKPLYLSLAVIFGIIVSLGSAFLIEFFDHSIETTDDVRLALGIPVLTSIPETELYIYRKRHGKATKSKLPKENRPRSKKQRASNAGMVRQAIISNT